MFKSFSDWMQNTANVLFDDTKNDLRALPKTVRLQILIVLSGLWSTAFSLYIFTVPMFVYGWLGVILGHLGVIFVAYYTFKQFQDLRRFRTDPNYHTPTRSRQNVWINGKQTKLPKDDVGGEHE
jgi:4-hydroxybenzoate polyprenyltransferase